MGANQFGEKLKELRSVSYTQTELGELLGVGIKQVQRYENGEVLPDHEKVKQLCELFKYDFVGLIYNGQWSVKTGATDTKYVALMEERVKELKEDKEWLKRNFEFSLNSISVQSASILAHVATSLEKDDEREAAGNKSKLQQLKNGTGKRIGDKLQALQKTGIQNSGGGKPGMAI